MYIVIENMLKGIEIVTVEKFETQMGGSTQLSPTFNTREEAEDWAEENLPD